MHARTLEVLDARGLAEELLMRAVPASTRCSSCAGCASAWAALPTRYPFLLITPQYEVEQPARAASRRRRAL